jgi:uncharacterized protein (DUF427 family)
MVADTHRPHLLFETNHPVRYYIPQEDVRMDLLVPSDTTSRCPYKGPASYWSVKLGDSVLDDMIWGYMEPIPECPKIKGLLCFFHERGCDIYVDGERCRSPDQMGASLKNKRKRPMRALYWDGYELSLNLSYPTPQEAKIKDRESKIVGATGSRPGFSDDQAALIKIHLAGICSTDLQIFKGYMGFKGVPGHEFVGSVVAGPQELVSKRVVGEINFACGRCDYCRGLAATVLLRSVMGISSRRSCRIRLRAGLNLHLVPASVSDEEAVFGTLAAL